MPESTHKRFLKRVPSILRKLRKKRRQQRALLLRKVRVAEDFKQLELLDTFHRAIRPYLCLAQIFGMMPLTNVWSKNPQAVHFQLRSFSMCFAVIFLMLGGIKTTRIGIKVFQGGLNAKNMVSLVFFSSGICICIGFILFARNWSRLIVPWSSIDIIMLYPPYAPTKRSLHRQLLMAGGMLGAVALVEHFLYYASSYYSYQMHVVQCDKNLTNTVFVSYMEHEFSDIFDFLPYNELVIFYAFFINSTFTFIWNFMDTFIILISIGLAQRFQQFATRVLTLEHCFVPETLWFNLRQHHILLCELVELVDAHLSHIILFSCLNNIYFICNKILAIFTKLRYGINHAYFWYSLIFLLGRTCAVFLCASKIHDASLLPLQVVYAVPSNSWSEEVQRFTHQLHNQQVGLSGCRLYYLTRMSLFGMVATLVYYEFMLLQLDAKGHKQELPNLCD